MDGARARTTRTAAALLCAVASAAAIAVQAAEAPRWYVGAGSGASRLVPGTRGSAFTLEKDGSVAFGAVLGRGIGDRYALELAVTSLGEAGLSDGESIDYRALSGGALAYLFGDPARLRRGEGSAAFARLGFSRIDNDSDVPLEREDNTAPWFGVGIDVPVSRSWGLRAEIASFDGDAQAAIASLLWRPGAPRPIVLARERRAPPPVTERPLPPTPASVAAPVPPAVPERVAPAPGPLSVPVPPPVPEPEPTAPTADCPAPAAGEPLDARGCPLFGGVLRGVDFAAGDDTPTPIAERRLTRLAEELLAHPGVIVEIRAHVSATAGDADAAQALSRRRALATARSLAGHGVPVSRLRARAFGSTRPRVEGATPGARRLNERIELGVLPR